MICPECGTEFDGGVEVCADCEVALVDAPADGGDGGEVELVPLVESMDVGFFSAVTAALEAAGIAWFVQGEESLGLLPRDGRQPSEPGVHVAVIYADRNRLEEAQTLVDRCDPVLDGVQSGPRH